MTGMLRSRTTRSGGAAAARSRQRPRRRPPVPRSHGPASDRSTARRICGSSSTTRIFVIPASGSEKTNVAPPPGVSSSQSSPPIRSRNPFAIASPRPGPRFVVALVEPGERQEELWRAAASSPAPWSTTRTGTRRPGVPTSTSTAARRHGPPRGRRCPAGWTRTRGRSTGSARAVVPARRTPSRRDASGQRTSAASTSAVDGLCEVDRLETCAEHAGLDPRHVQKVRDERVEPIGLVVDHRQHGVTSVRIGAGNLGVEEIGDRRLDRGQRAAEIVRDRRQHVAPRRLRLPEDLGVGRGLAAADHARAPARADRRRPGAPAPPRRPMAGARRSARSDPRVRAPTDSGSRSGARPGSAGFHDGEIAPGGAPTTTRSVSPAVGVLHEEGACRRTRTARPRRRAARGRCPRPVRAPRGRG